MTFKVGDEVTFYYKGRTRLTGNITMFEALSAYTDQPADTEVVATVHVPGDHGGRYYGALKLSKLRRADHPSAKAAAAVSEQKPGALVRVTGMRARTIAGVSEGSVAVVLADKGDRLNVVAVGGSTDKYQYLRVPRHQVTPVSLDLDALLQRQLSPPDDDEGTVYHSPPQMYCGRPGCPCLLPAPPEFPPASKPYETDGQSVLDALHTVDTEGL